MIPRTLFPADYEIFRDSVRRFVADEITPNYVKWEHDARVPREVWLKGGAAGLLCCEVPEEYGGPGGDFLHSVVVMEELADAGATGVFFGLHSDIVAPYILKYGSPQQKKQWLTRMAPGEAIGAIAMTSLRRARPRRSGTTARRDGDDYVINGQKVFISNGQQADLVIVACKTDATKAPRA